MHSTAQTARSYEPQASKSRPEITVFASRVTLVNSAGRERAASRRQPHGLLLLVTDRSRRRAIPSTARRTAFSPDRRSNERQNPGNGKALSKIRTM